MTWYRDKGCIDISTYTGSKLLASIQTLRQVENIEIRNRCVYITTIPYFCKDSKIQPEQRDKREMIYLIDAQSYCTKHSSYIYWKISLIEIRIRTILYQYGVFTRIWKIKANVSYVPIFLAHMNCEPFLHANTMAWRSFPYYWPFVSGIHQSPFESRTNGWWYGIWVFLLNKP